MTIADELRGVVGSLTPCEAAIVDRAADTITELYEVLEEAKAAIHLQRGFGDLWRKIEALQAKAGAA